MSGMLYSLAIEPLLHKLQGEFKGLTLPNWNSCFYLCAYADDLIMFVTRNDDIGKTGAFCTRRFSSAKLNCKTS